MAKWRDQIRFVCLVFFENWDKNAFFLHLPWRAWHEEKNYSDHTVIKILYSRVLHTVLQSHILMHYREVDAHANANYVRIAFLYMKILFVWNERQTETERQVLCSMLIIVAKSKYSKIRINSFSFTFFSRNCPYPFLGNLQKQTCECDRLAIYSIWNVNVMWIGVYL